MTKLHFLILVALPLLWSIAGPANEVGLRSSVFTTGIDEAADARRHTGRPQSAISAIPVFADFPVRDAFRGRPAAPVLATPEARRFRTELRRQAADGPNFAGFYTFARWGCGAGCVK